MGLFKFHPCQVWKDHYDSLFHHCLGPFLTSDETYVLSWSFDLSPFKIQTSHISLLSHLWLSPGVGNVIGLLLTVPREARCGSLSACFCLIAVVRNCEVQIWHHGGMSPVSPGLCQQSVSPTFINMRKVGFGVLLEKILQVSSSGVRWIYIEAKLAWWEAV